MKIVEDGFDVWNCRVLICLLISIIILIFQSISDWSFNFRDFLSKIFGFFFFRINNFDECCLLFLCLYDTSVVLLKRFDISISILTKNIVNLRSLEFSLLVDIHHEKIFWNFLSKYEHTIILSDCVTFRVCVNVRSLVICCSWLSVKSNSNQFSFQKEEEKIVKWFVDALFWNFNLPKIWMLELQPFWPSSWSSKDHLNNRHYVRIIKCLCSDCVNYWWNIHFSCSE